MKISAEALKFALGPDVQFNYRQACVLQFVRGGALLSQHSKRVLMMKNLTVMCSLPLLSLVWACDGDSAVAQNGGAPPGSGGGYGGSGGGSAGMCPLDADAQTQAEKVLTGAIADSKWIIDNTHGTGQFAGRGFGLTIPFTPVAALNSVSLLEACTEAKDYVPYCEQADPSQGDFKRCSQLKCTGAGKLEARGWFDPTPFDAVGEPGPVTINVSMASNVVSFEDVTATSVKLAWTTELALTPTDSEVSIEASGTATNTDAGTESMSLSVVLTGLSAEPLTVTMTHGDTLQGEGKVGGLVVLKVDDGSVTWAGPCLD